MLVVFHFRVCHLADDRNLMISHKLIQHPRRVMPEALAFSINKCILEIAFQS